MHPSKETLNALITAQTGEANPQAQAVLQTLLEHTSPLDIQAATLVNQLATADIDVSESLPKYRELFGGPSNPNRYPEHKIEWYVEAVSIVLKLLQMAEGKALRPTVIHRVFEFLKFFDRHYVAPETKALWDNPANWKHTKGYQDQIWRHYTGPYWVEKAVKEHSRFSHQELALLLHTMMDRGDLDLTADRRYRLLAPQN